LRGYKKLDDLEQQRQELIEAEREAKAIAEEEGIDEKLIGLALKAARKVPLTIASFFLSPVGILVCAIVGIMGLLMLLALLGG
jgi:hypothetical protein